MQHYPSRRRIKCTSGYAKNVAKRFGVVKPVSVATRVTKMPNLFAKDEMKNGEMPKSKDLHKEDNTNEKKLNTHLTSKADKSQYGL